MTWLKLTSKALYLMKSGTDSFLEKVELQDHPNPNSTNKEYELDLPLNWFRNVDAPGGMVISMKATKEPTKVEVVSDPTLATVIKAEAWGAEPAGPFEITKPKYLIIHHTASQNPPNDSSRRTLNGAKQLAKLIQQEHMHNPKFGFSDSGHNFLNTTGGFLLEGRHGSLSAIIKGRCVRSAHTKSKSGEINESPGIENEGNFMTHKMDAKQWNSLLALCVAICKSCNISPDNIKGHRDFFQTNCPGNWLYSQLPRLRQEVRAKLK